MLVRFEVSRFEVDCARGADKNVPRPIICPTVTVLGKSKMRTILPTPTPDTSKSCHAGLTLAAAVAKLTQ